MNRHKDSIIAAALTMAVCGVLLLVLFFGHLGYNEATLAEASTPELMPLEDEEMFIAPELIQDAGEPEATADAEPSPVAQGVEEAASSPAPRPEAQTAIAQEKPSKTVMKKDKDKADSKQPEKTDEQVLNRDKEKAGADVRKGFSKPSSTNGSGGSGVGIAGSAPGRRFLGCDAPDIALREKTVIKVYMSVDSEGRVISVSDASGGTQDMRAKCKAAARTARWSAKKGAAPTPATIIFTITPKR